RCPRRTLQAQRTGLLQQALRGGLCAEPRGRGREEEHSRPNLLRLRLEDLHPGLTNCERVCEALSADRGRLEGGGEADSKREVILRRYRISDPGLRSEGPLHRQQDRDGGGNLRAAEKCQG